MSQIETKELKFYKPNKNGNGSASQWQLSKKENEWNLFLSMAKQKGVSEDTNNAIFDWQNKIIAKLGTPDLGEMLAVISGRKDSIGTKDGLFHKTQNSGSKIIKLSRSEYGYSLALSAKADNTDAVQAYHSLTDGEMEVLRVFIVEALKLINGW